MRASEQGERSLMPTGGAHTVLSDEVRGNGDETQLLDTGNADLVEDTTPTRKLEFGRGPSATSNSLALETQAWERDIAAFLMSQSHMPLSDDSHWGLQVDFCETRGSKGLYADVQSEASSPPLVAVTSSRRPMLPVNSQDNCAGKEEVVLPNSMVCEKKSLPPSPSHSSSGATVDDAGEQVLIGVKLPYCDAHAADPHLLAQTPPPLERGLSTPCLIPTPEGHMFRAGQVSQAPTESVATFDKQDFSPGEEANIIPQHVWNCESQMRMEEVVATRWKTAVADSFQETIDDECMKDIQATISELPAIGNSFVVKPLETVLHPSKKVFLAEKKEEKGKKMEETCSKRPSSRTLEEKCGENDFDDAPFFKRIVPGCTENVLRETTVVSYSKPLYTIGMRVEGQWGRRWYGAVVTEEERNGYVQVCWDDDGSLLHLKCREVRPLSIRAESFGKKSCENGAGVSGGGWETGRGKLNTPSIVTATPPRSRNLVTSEQQSNGVEGDGWVNVSMLTVYLTQPTIRSLAASAERVLETLQQHGALIMEFLLHLKSLDAEAIPFSRRQQISKENNTNMTDQKQEKMCFFIVTEEETREKDGNVIMIAHAMGVSAVSIRWLERLGANGACNCQRVFLPNSQEVMGQDEDLGLRCRLLPREERFLANKVIYVSEEETDVSFIITVCGGIVTHQLSLDGSMLLPPDYVYVAPGKRARIAPNIASVALLEKPWLIHRVHEFFFSFPSLRQKERDDIVSDTDLLQLMHSSGTKRSRQQQEEEEIVTHERKQKTTTLTEQPVVMPQGQTWSDGSAPATLRGDNANSVYDEDNGRLEVLVGEDYYFRITRVKYSNEAPEVALGRVVHFHGAGNVAMRLYEMKHRVLRQNPRTRNLENHTTVYLGSRIVEVSVEDLIFDIPVYVVDTSQMQHVYALESPPRSDNADGGENTNATYTSTFAVKTGAPVWNDAE